MLADFLGAIWRYLPGRVRRRLVRIGQSRFTVTAGAFLFDDEDRILLLEHQFRPDSRWGIPGGFLSKGEQPAAALVRELREEIKLEVTNVEFLFARTLPKAHQVEIYFRCKPASVPTPSSFEIIKAEWFMIEELPDKLSSDQRTLIKRALAVGEKSNE